MNPFRIPNAAAWIAGALLLTATAAVADHRGHGHGFAHRGHGPGDGRHLERMARLLDLTDEQREEIRELHEERVAAAEAEHREIEALHERVEEMIAAERPDATAIGELVIEIHARRDALRASRDDVRAEIEALLTPEQRELFDRMEEMRDDGDGRRSMRRRRMPGRGR